MLSNKTIKIEVLVNIELIENYIAKNNITKKQFAKICQISLQDLTKVLDNHSDFSIDLLFNIAKTMQIQIKDIFNKNKNVN